MKTYEYIAQDAANQIVRGRLQAEHPGEIRARLQARGIRLLTVEQSNWGMLELRWEQAGSLLRKRPLRGVEVELFLQQLAVMLGSGLELTAALRDLEQHSTSARLRATCRNLLTQVQAGDSFAESIANSKRFPPIVQQLVGVGEQTGELPITLERAAEFLERRRATLGGIRSALSYPIFVAVSAFTVAIYLVVSAIPKLSLFLNTMGRDLPAMTQSLVDLSDFVRQYGVVLSVSSVASLVAIGLLYCWAPGRYRIDRLILRIPILGSLAQVAETQQFASTLALMLRSGVRLPEALEAGAKLHSNHYLAEQVRQMVRRVVAGQALADSIGTDRGFAPLLPNMAAVGERTGDLPKCLEHVALFYNKDLDRRLKKFVGLLEPAIIVFVGGIVGYVYIAFFMALISAGGNFK
jgi:type II secretory pathway component PulF